MTHTPHLTPDARKAELQKAEQMAAKYLYLGNVARDKGQLELAGRHFEKAQWYHDRFNVLAGNVTFEKGE